MARGVKRFIFQAPTGCHRRGQGILMFDGTIRRVEDIAVGDMLMGPDSKPREVLRLCRGTQRMVRISPIAGNPFVVNIDHVLSLVCTNGGRLKVLQDGEVIDISVRDYLRLSKSRKHLLKLFRTGVTFANKFNLKIGDYGPQGIDPYFLGILLGDGSIKYNSIGVTTMDKEILFVCEQQLHLYNLKKLRKSVSRTGAPTYFFSGVRGKPNILKDNLQRLGLHGCGSESKFVPQAYKIASRQDRLYLLAGLMDTDGSTVRGGFDYVSKSKRLAMDVVFLTRSLGLAAHINKSRKRDQHGTSGTYWRVYISGDCSIIPTNIKRKQSAPRLQKKNVLRTGFQVRRLGIEEYFGFELDGDGRYLLDDFIVTHNSGKTILSAVLIKKMLERGKRVLFAAHRRELVTQPYSKFVEDVNIPLASIGVIKSDLKKLRNPSAPIQIVSIQSVYQKALPPADVVVIDECHLARSNSYDWLIKQYPDAFLIGLTATATRLDGRSLGDVFDEIVVVAQPSELYEKGYIVRPKMFTVPESKLPDLTGLHHVAGDFKEDELNERVMKTVIMGSIVDHYGERARGLRAMSCGVSIKHSKAICDMLNGAGIRARHIDGTTSSAERVAALKDLEAGEYDVLCQVGLWIEGLDCPPLKCLIQARPTESIVIHLQSFGRIVRPWNDVTPIMLDHAANCIRLGRPTKDWEFSLRDEKRVFTKRELQEKVCKTCFAIVEASATVCPECGTALTRERKIENDTDTKLVEMREPTLAEVQRDAYKKLWRVAYRDGFDTYWVIRRFAEKYGSAPPRDWTPPEREVINYTFEQKKKTVAGWRAAMGKNPSLTTAWLENHYQLKFQEPMGTFNVQLEQESQQNTASDALKQQLAATEVSSENVKKVPLNW